MRTVSKLGLAGLRLGYIAGDPQIIEQLHKLRLPYNINILTQVSVDFALSNNDLFNRQTRAICTERSRVYQHLTLLDNIIVYPSSANFILFRTRDNCSDRTFSFLKEQGILIKNLSPQGGLLTNCLRVTVGKPEENNAFLTALQNCFS
jgi:histidinol-phosphate aminotransferase